MALFINGPFNHWFTRFVKNDDSFRNVCVCVCVIWYHACSCDVGVCCHLVSQQVWCSPQLILYHWMLHFLTNLHQMETI